MVERLAGFLSVLGCYALLTGAFAAACQEPDPCALATECSNSDTLTALRRFLESEGDSASLKKSAAGQTER